MDRDNIGVAQSSQSARFTVETLAEPRAGRNLRRKDFKGDKTIEGLLAGLVNRAHPTLADQGDDFQLREQLCKLLNRRRLE
jgi:hypothetical protein